MQLIPGGSLIFSFDVQSSTGTPVDFDVAPTVTFYHNGVADSTWTSYTLTNVVAGHYILTTTVPSGYALADEISVYVNGTISSVAVGLTAFEGQLANTPDNATVNGLTVGGTYATASAIWGAAATSYNTPGTLGNVLNGMAMSVWNVLANATFTAGSMALWILGLQSASAAVVLPTAPPAGYATSTAQTTILNAVNAITTNVARAKMVLPTFMARPSTGLSVYAVNVYLYNLEGHLEDADSNTITIAAANAAGGSLNTGLSSTTMTRVSAGLYTVNYMVNPTDATGEAIFSIAWAVGGVAMASAMASMIEDAESLATLAAIEAKTALIATNAGDSPNAVTAQGTVSTNLDATVSSRSTYAGGAVASVTAPVTLAASQDFNNTGQTTPYPTSGGGGGSSGSGAWQVIVPVTDNATPANPLQNITVSLTLNASVFSAVTDSSGNATFNLNTGVYSEAAAHPLYSVVTSGPVTVAANMTAATIVMAPVAIPAAPSGSITGIAYTMAGSKVVPFRTVKYYLSSAGAGTGLILNGDVLFATSDANGLLAIAFPYSTTWIIMGSPDVPVIVPASGSQFSIPNVNVV